MDVAVTGSTGTVGRELISRLEQDARIERIVASARKPRDGAELGWRRTSVVPADVRDPAALDRVFAGADAVVHAAFAIYGGRRSHAELHAINVDGTVNVAEAAVCAGVTRFVYLSSIAAYGIRPDNPQPLTEDDALRPTPDHFYASHKSEAEPRLRAILEAAGIETYVLRPCGIVGPHAMGAALDEVPSRLIGLGRRVLRSAARAGLRRVLVAPAVPTQFVHADDVAAAAQLCLHGDGPAGAYNLAGEDIVEGEDVPRLLGMRTLPLPRAVRRPAMRAVARLQSLYPAAAWPLTFAEPVIVDTTKARTALGW
ncbi:MAG: NAD-dependent epimerase/dehydratase, partial [Solirubrobacterales bacterium]|nr:NAD-dependent epimerase/dehydratase [Solirubrobacterales bacterium]